MSDLPPLALTIVHLTEQTNLTLGPFQRHFTNHENLVNLIQKQKRALTWT